MYVDGIGRLIAKNRDCVNDAAGMTMPYYRSHGSVSQPFHSSGIWPCKIAHPERMKSSI